MTTTTDPPSGSRDPAGMRVLVMSLALAPCYDVGGKRFSFLSRFLSERCDHYHVLARIESMAVEDPSAYTGNVHRVRAWPDFVPQSRRRLDRLWNRVWQEWLCIIDPYAGWMLPAFMRGVRLCREHDINVIVVTMPPFSQLASALALSKIYGAALVIDYRDPMTTMKRAWPAVFGKWLARLLETAALRHAKAVVFCSDIMRDELVKSFGNQVPAKRPVIRSGFLGFECDSEASLGAGRINMLYAGEFYGSRRLAVIARTLRDMQLDGEIGPDNFRLHVYSMLRPDDHELVRSLGIEALIEEHGRVPYADVKRLMRAADILFLPSGEEVSYAIPYKFYDYLSVRRPILAVSPVNSAVEGLMSEVDCGEFAPFGDHDAIRAALVKLLRKERVYTFTGAERCRWQNSADAYVELLRSVVRHGGVGG